MSATRGFYRHYKGPFYEILNYAQRESDGARMVVYQPCAGNEFTARPLPYVRPAAEFFETITRGDFTGQRFTFCFEIPA